MSQNVVDSEGTATTNSDHCDDAYRYALSIRVLYSCIQTTLNRIRFGLPQYIRQKNIYIFQVFQSVTTSMTHLARAALSGLLSTTAN